MGSQRKLEPMSKLISPRRWGGQPQGYPAVSFTEVKAEASWHLYTRSVRGRNGRWRWGIVPAGCLPCLTHDKSEISGSVYHSG